MTQQRDELETIQLQSANANARLSRLRTQRDALKARLQVARARYEVAEATPRSRRLPRRAVVFLASLLLLIACAAAWRWTRPPAPDSPASDATAAISPAADPASAGGTSEKAPDGPTPESAETKPYSLLDLPLDATQRHFTLPVNGTAAQFTEEASGKVAQVVIGGEDGSLFAVQILQGRFESRARRLRGHGSRVNSLAWNPVAHRVASAGDDGQILVWDHPALTLLRRLAQGNRVKGLAFSTNGGQLLSGGQGAARLWDVLSGDPLQNYVEPRAHGNVSAVAWSPDGSGFAIGQNVQGAAAIHVVNLEGTQWRDIPGSAANYLEFLDGGEKLIGVSAKSLAVWNVQDGSTVRSFGDGIACVAFGRHARRAVSGHADGRVILWDTETGQVLHESRMPKRVESISLAKHGEWAVATSGRDVQLFELPPEVVPYRRREFATTAEIRALAVSPTEFSVLSASDQQGELWNLANPQSGRSALTGPGPCNSAAYTPDGNRVLLARAQPDRQGFGPISYVEVPRRGLGSDAILRRYLGHRGGTNAALFVRNGTRVVSGGNDNHVRIWETSTEQELGDFEVEGAVRSLAASPDGKRLALLAGGVEVEIWDLDAKAPAGRLAGHSLAPQVVAWARQAPRVATACGDGTARVWDANTLANLATFAHPRGVTAVDLSPDGRWLVTGGQDGRVRIWDVAGQRAGKAWSAHESVVTAVAVAVDGRTFVSAGGDYRLCWWDLPTD